jgi:hypothetical protein
LPLKIPIKQGDEMVSVSIVALPAELTKMSCGGNISQSGQWYGRDSKIRNGKRQQTGIMSVFQSFATIVVRSYEAETGTAELGKSEALRPPRAAASITNIPKSALEICRDRYPTIPSRLHEFVRM